MMMTTLLLVLQLVVASFISRVTASFNRDGVAAFVQTVAGGGEPHEGDGNECKDEPRSRDGTGFDARFSYPWGIAYDSDTNSLYVADCGCGDFTPHSNERIRAIRLETKEVTTLAGGKKGYSDGMKKTAMFSNPSGLAVHHKARKIYLTDTGNHCIRSVDIETGGVSTLVGAAREHGFVDGIGPKAQFKTPQGICIDERRNLLYVSDTDNHVIRRIHIDTREVVTISGTFRKHGNEDGTGSEARFYHPTALTYNSEDDILYVSDHYNHLVRKIESPDRLPIVSTLAGSVQGHKDGFGKNAQFDYPEGIAYDSVHQLIYVTEFENNCIRFVTKEGNVGTLAGGGKRGSENGEGKVASFFHPTGMAYDPTRNILFVTDQYNHKVRSISILKVDAQPKTSWSFSNVLVIGFACVTTFSVTCYFVSKKRSTKRGRKWID